MYITIQQGLEIAKDALKSANIDFTQVNDTFYFKTEDAYRRALSTLTEVNHVMMLTKPDN